MTDHPINSAPLVLRTLTGSRAYGTSHDGSDWDFIEVRAWPASVLTGLHPPAAGESYLHSISSEGDIGRFDVAHFMRSLLGGQTVAFETLWAPSHELVTPPGSSIVAAREELTTREAVRHGYLSYSSGLLRGLSSGSRSLEAGGAPVEKAARTVYRLAVQGELLWTTGSLSIRLPDPQAALDFGVRTVAEQDLDGVRGVVDRLAATMEGPTPLPSATDETTALATRLIDESRTWASHR